MKQAVPRKTLRGIPLFFAYSLFAMVLTLGSESYALEDNPGADDFEGAAPLAGNQIAVTAHNQNASRQAGEPKHGGDLGGRSIWWKWTASKAGVVEVSTAGSDFDTLVAVYTGDSLGALSLVVANDDAASDSSSLVRFPAISGVSYYIAVDGYRGATGAVTLSLAFLQAPNDQFALSPLLTELSRVKGHNFGASSEDGEIGGMPSIWWSWRAPEGFNTALELTVYGRRLNGEQYSPYVAIYSGEGSTPAELEFLLDNEQFDPDQFESTFLSTITFTPQPGILYHFGVEAVPFHRQIADSRFDTRGFVELAFFSPGGSLARRSPPNDRFADRIELTSTSTRQITANFGATSESGEPAHAETAAGHTLWWTWMAPADGALNVRLLSKTAETVLALYSGGSLETLQPLAAHSSAEGDSRRSQVNHAVSAGSRYYIAADTQAGKAGDLELQLEFLPSGGRRPRLLVAEELSTLATLQISPPPDEDGRYAPATSVGVLVTPLPGSPLPWTGPQFFDLVLSADVDLAREIGRLAAVLSKNHTFAQRSHFSGESTLLMGSNAGSALELEPGELDHVAFGRPVDRRTQGARAAHSDWWTWTAPTNGTVTIRRHLGFPELTLAVYKTTSLPDEEDDLVASNVADRPATLSGSDFYRTTVDHLRVSVEAGATYQLAVASFIPPEQTVPLGKGSYILQFAFLPLPPNDSFTNRTVISDFSIPVEGYNIGADPLPETGELALRDNYGHSVWWSWTPSETGWVSLTSNGSDFDSFIAVYQGAALNALELIACGDATPLPNRSAGSRVTFLAEAGVPYAIAVSGGRMFLDRRSGDRTHPDSVGRIRLELRKLALTKASNLEIWTNHDGTTGFKSEVRLDNFAPIATGPMRVRLIARPGYSQLEGLIFPGGDQPLWRDQELGAFAVSPTPGNSHVKIPITGVAPAPEAESLSGVGWGVFAILEGQFGNQWFKIDDTWVLYSVWPTVGNVAGPGGGVLRLNPGVREANREIFKIAIVDENRKVVDNKVLIREGTQRNFAAVVFFTPVSQPFAQPINQINCPGDCDVWALNDQESVLETLFDPGSRNLLARINAATLEQTIVTTLSAEATFNGKTVRATVPIELVAKPTPLLTWSDPAPIRYPAPLGPNELNAVEDNGLPGTFTYHPPAGTVLPPGDHTLSVLFKPQDSANYESAERTVRLTVLPPEQPKFASVEIQANQLVFKIERSASVKFVLDKTDDFVSWKEIQILEASPSGEVQEITIPTDGELGFFRLRYVP